MRVLLTGSTGVIGRTALPHLVSAGHDVLANYRSSDDRVWLENVGARPVSADLFSPDDLRRVAVGVDAVAHFATAIPRLSDMGDRSSWEMNDRLRTAATSHLVDVALGCGAARFVQESITFIYADGGDAWLDESAPVDPVSDTLRSALTAEGHVDRFRTGGGTGVVLRMAGLYGPGKTSAEYIAAVRSGQIPIVGNGDNYVSSLHIADAAMALVAALTAPDGVYNVGDDAPMKSGDNLTALARVLGAPEPRRVPAGVGSRHLTISHRVSNRAFRSATGWAPKHPDAASGWAASVD